MGYSKQAVDRAMVNAEKGCADENDKGALDYMANSGQAGSRTRECKRLLEKANKQRH